MSTYMERLRKGHKTPWPGLEGHSGNGRPVVYRAADGWWVDDSGTDPNSWSDDWDQHLEPTWELALAYALASVERARVAYESGRPLESSGSAASSSPITRPEEAHHERSTSDQPAR